MSYTDQQISFEMSHDPSLAKVQPKPLNEQFASTNFQINAQFQMAGPAFESPQQDGYGDQQVTAEINGQEILMSCENAGMLPQTEIKLPEPDPKVCSPVAELFGRACDSVSQVTAQVNAEFLQPVNVAVPTPDPAPTPQWTPSYNA